MKKMNDGQAQHGTHHFLGNKRGLVCPNISNDMALLNTSIFNMIHDILCSCMLNFVNTINVHVINTALMKLFFLKKYSNFTKFIHKNAS